MKTTRLLFLLLFILSALIFLSCSSDDDNGNDEGSYHFGPKNDFTRDLLKTYSYSTFTYNEDGLLKEVTNTVSGDKITFQYPPKTKSIANTTIVTMKVEKLKDPEIYYTIKLEIGSNGFATRGLETYANNSTLIREFKYNSDGQLNYIKKSYGDYSDAVTLIYSNGNITRTEWEYNSKYESVQPSIEYSFEYTSDSHTEGIDNKGSIMLFSHFYYIPLGEMEFAYYAGLLGCGTKKLPLNRTETHTTNEIVNSKRINNFDWNLNTKGYPTKATISIEGLNYVSFDFGW